MTTLKEIEKLAKSPEIRKGIAINRKVKKLLHKKYPKLSSKALNRVVSEIPDYNPRNIRDAVRIGEYIINKSYMRTH